MRNSAKVIYILNDQVDSNLKYRLNVINLLKENGWTIQSVGLSFALSRPRIFKSLVLSSNIKANILTLILGNANSTVILNGLGRLGAESYFRKFIGILISNYRGKCFVQNYRDYRYFRRYSKKNKCLEWVPGSGSRKKEVGVNGTIVVTRDNKFNLQLKSIRDFISRFKLDEIKIIGLKSAAVPKINGCRINSIGIVQQENLLMDGRNFLWLSGYGDGFPHSLSDALYNRMNVYIEKREYINFGMYKMKYKIRKNNNWYEVISNVDNEGLSESTIAHRYTEKYLSYYG